MPSHCNILAHHATGRVYRCPNHTGHGFHYHGQDRRAPFRPLVGAAICGHRHQTVRSAEVCSERAAWEYVRSLCQEIERTYTAQDAPSAEDIGRSCVSAATVRFTYRHHRSAVNTDLRLCDRHATMYREHFSEDYRELGPVTEAPPWAHAGILTRSRS